MMSDPPRSQDDRTQPEPPRRQSATQCARSLDEPQATALLDLVRASLAIALRESGRVTSQSADACLRITREGRINLRTPPELTAEEPELSLACLEHLTTLAVWPTEVSAGPGAESPASSAPLRVIDLRARLAVRADHASWLEVTAAERALRAATDASARDALHRTAVLSPCPTASAAGGRLILPPQSVEEAWKIAQADPDGPYRQLLATAQDWLRAAPGEPRSGP